MLIPITLSPKSASNPKLPPSLAKISDDEVVLIELQGSLDVDCNHPSDRNGQFVGKLMLDRTTNRPTLIIGHHLLEGQIQTLAKPLAVLVRSKKSANTDLHSPSGSRTHDETEDADEAMAVDERHKNNEHDLDTPRSAEIAGADEGDGLGNPSRREGGLDASGTSWTITAVVKKKIIFSKRPMPLTNTDTR